MYLQYLYFKKKIFIMNKKVSPYWKMFYNLFWKSKLISRSTLMRELAVLSPLPIIFFLGGNVPLNKHPGGGVTFFFQLFGLPLWLLYTLYTTLKPPILKNRYLKNTFFYQFTEQIGWCFKKYENVVNWGNYNYNL